MTRVLAVLRRILLAGTVSLVFSFIVLGVSGKRMIDLANSHNNIAGIFSLFFLSAPLVYLIMTLLSAIYIRKFGQFAAVHQTQSPVTTFFRCVGSDLVSPFKCIKNFFFAIFSKNVMGKDVIIRRFVGMVILILVCIVGMGSLIS